MFHKQIQPQPEPPPTPGTYFLKFQHQLAASEHVALLARCLAHVHFLYEGWGVLAESGLAGDLKRVYTEAACFAVRWCSNVERRVAQGKAERWAIDNMWQLRKAQLNSHSHEEAEQLLRDYARGIIDEYRFTLMHGVRALSVRDQLRVAEIEAPDVAAD